MHHHFVWREEQTRKCFSITTLIEVVCATLYQVWGQLNQSHSYEVSVAFPTNSPDGSEPAVGKKLKLHLFQHLTLCHLVITPKVLSL